MGRFTLWPDAGTMNDQFRRRRLVASSGASQCPGVVLREQLELHRVADQVAGQLLCGSFQGRQHRVDTNFSATYARRGRRPDIDSLFKWWAGSGNPGGAPITGVLA